MVSFRIDTTEKKLFAATAHRKGYDSFAAFNLDCLRAASGLNVREDHMIVGHLGQIGAEINTLAHVEAEIFLNDGQEQLKSINKRIAALQRDIMKGTDHACEEDS